MSNFSLSDYDKRQTPILVTLSFVLFLYSGQIRPLLDIVSPALNIIPLVVSLGVCFCFFFYYIIFKTTVLSSEFLTLNSILLFITAILVLSCLYTPSESHYLQKLGQWLIMVFCFLFPQVIKLRTSWFIYSFCAGSVVVFCIFWFAAQFEDFFILLNIEKELLRYLSTLYLTAATYIGAAIILVFFYKKNYPLLLLLVVLLLMTGARGPLLILFMSFFIWLFISGKIIFRAKAVVSLFVGAIVAFYLGIYFELPIFERLLLRFGFLLEEGGGNSIAARFVYFQQAIDGIEYAPLLGNGFGSFGYLTTGVDFKEYPHNLLLEAWYDAGVVAAIAFLVFFIVTNYLAIQSKNWGLFILVNYFFLNSLKSSSYVDHRAMLAVMAFIIIEHAKLYRAQRNTKAVS